MKELMAIKWDRDRELSGDIVPEAYFRCSALRELEFPWPDAAFERQVTEVRAAWTDRFLYWHLWLKDSWIVAEDQIVVALRHDPSGPVWTWTVSSSGQVQAALCQDGSNKAWKSSAVFRVRRHDAGWVAEGKIPLQKDLGTTPKPGDGWNATVTRVDVDRRGRTSRSTLEADPSAYSRLIFG